jgi:hypothetical protein
LFVEVAIITLTSLIDAEGVDPEVMAAKRFGNGYGVSETFW